MATAKDLLQGRKAGLVFSIRPDAEVKEALEQLSIHNIGALLVMQPDGKVVGILSERDIVRKFDLHTDKGGKTKVQDIMTSKVLFVEAGQTVEECMALMNEKNIRHLPVFENDNLLGLISIRDVLRKVISDQQIFITHLEQYIRRG